MKENSENPAIERCPFGSNTPTDRTMNATDATHQLVILLQLLPRGSYPDILALPDKIRRIYPTKHILSLFDLFRTEKLISCRIQEMLRCCLLNIRLDQICHLRRRRYSRSFSSPLKGNHFCTYSSYFLFFGVSVTCGMIAGRVGR